MKALVLTLALLTAGAAPAFAQTTLASWNFDTATIGATNTDFGPVAADIGSGSATGHHASASTAWSAPVGNGSAKSFSSNNWAAGDYYQFQTGAAGQSGLAVSFDQTGSGTGPKDFRFSFSTDGTNFTQFATYSVLLNGTPNPAWNVATSSGIFHNSFDLSSISALDNATTVYFRLIDNSTVSLGGGTVGTGGTDRVDNLTVTAIPEPATYALCSGLAGFAAVWFRRQRQVLA